MRGCRWLYTKPYGQIGTWIQETIVAPPLYEPVTCPTCDDNSDCGAGNYCTYFAYGWSSPGVCQVQPANLSDPWGLGFNIPNTVCGCDGNPYHSQCYAFAANISMAYQSACTCDDGACDVNDCTFCPSDCANACSQSCTSGNSIHAEPAATRAATNYALQTTRCGELLANVLNVGDALA